VSRIRRLWYTVAALRLHNCLIAASSVATGAFLAEGRVGAQAATVSGMTLLVCAGAYGFNDICDVQTDSVNKPRRPIPAGMAAPRDVAWSIVLCWAGAGWLAYRGGWIAVGFMACWVPLLVAYSWRLKSSGLLGHLLVSAVASSGFLLGAGTAGRASAGIIPFAVAVPLHMTREIIKSVADAPGDGRAGVSTLAVRMGSRRALGLTRWSIVAVMGVSMLPLISSSFRFWYFPAVIGGIWPMLLFCMRLIDRGREGVISLEEASSKAATVLKMVMPVGLAAFILARI
jgi:4-hydroxybenzoate polyprenyltransferase